MLPRLLPHLLLLAGIGLSVQAQPWPVPAALSSPLAQAGNDAHSAQNFGQSIAIHADWLAVGASFTAVDGRSDQGAVYVFRRVGARFEPVQRLVQNDGQSGDMFGAAVALHSDRLIVGVPGADIGADSNRGRVLAFTLQSGQFVEQQRLLGAGTDASDRFGQALDFNGQVLAVGAPYASVAAVQNVGAAYVFRLNAGSFGAAQRLEPSSRVAGDAFGWSLSVDADTLAIGAPTADVSGLTDCGAVSVFVANANTFSLQQTLYHPSRDQQDWFGWSLSVIGNRLYVGAPFDDWVSIDRGSVLPFVRAGTVWTAGSPMQAADAGTSDLFGYAVLAKGQELFISARDDQTTLSQQGSVYHFRGSDTPVYQRKMVDADPGATDLFGHALAFDNGQLAVSARLDDIGPVADTGSVSVYDLGDAAPAWRAKLSATRPQVAGEFGQIMASVGDELFIGMPSATRAGAGATGAVDWFHRQASGEWLFRQRFFAADGQAGDAFGAALVWTGSALIIGAPGASEQGQAGAGVIYLLRPQGNAYALSARTRHGNVQATAQFGAALAARGDHLLIGVPGAVVAGQANRGVVVVALVGAQALTFTQVLIDDQGSAGDRFGQVLAHATTGVAIAAPLADVAGLPDAGKVLLYDIQQDGLSRRYTHVAAKPQAFAHFGASLASSARLLAIGAPDADAPTATDQGQLSWLDWSAPDALRTLSSNNESAGAHFASALAVHGGLILASSSFADVAGKIGAGRVTMWMSNGAELAQIGDLVSADPETAAAFGRGLLMYGNRALIAAPLADALDAGSGLQFADAGKVHVYEPDAELTLAIDNQRAQVIQGLPDVSELLVANTGPQPLAEITIQAPAPLGLTDVQWTCDANAGAACPAQLQDASIDAIIDLPAGASLRLQRVGLVTAAAGSELDASAGLIVVGVSQDDPNNNVDADRDPVVLDLSMRDGFESD